MNNLFEKSYIEVTIPLTDEKVEQLENSSYDYLLDDYKRELDNPITDGVWCEMTVGFDIANGETHFNFNVIAAIPDEPPQVSSWNNIDFDPDTAEYFKNKALEHIARNFSVMNTCKYETVKVMA